MVSRPYKAVVAWTLVVIACLAVSSPAFAQNAGSNGDGAVPSSGISVFDPRGHFSAVLPAPMVPLDQKIVHDRLGIAIDSQRAYISRGREVAIVLAVVEWTNQIRIMMQVQQTDPLGVLIEDNLDSLKQVGDLTMEILSAGEFEAFGTRALVVEGELRGAEEIPLPHLTMYLVPYTDRMVVARIRAPSRGALSGQEAQIFSSSFNVINEP